jgi:hypothetical protein
MVGIRRQTKRNGMGKRLAMTRERRGRWDDGEGEKFKTGERGNVALG